MHNLIPQTSPIIWRFIRNILILIVITNRIFNNKNLTNNNITLNIIVNKNINWKW